MDGCELEAGVGREGCEDCGSFIGCWCIDSVSLPLYLKGQPQNFLRIGLYICGFRLKCANWDGDIVVTETLGMEGKLV